MQNFVRLSPDETCLERRLKLEAIFHSVSDGIISLDESLRITSLNRAAAQMTGFGQQEAVGHLYTDIFKTKAVDLQPLMEKVFKAPQRIEDVSVQLQPIHGEQRTLLLNLHPMVDDVGVQIGVVMIFKDVSEIEQLKEQLKGRYRFHRLIGKSKPMQEIYQLIEQTALSTASVLIEGESGTGKELVAHAIHYNSPRADHPFIPVNCSALPETLLESELFGHVRGAFTGAVAGKMGRFEAADGGTIFLDEVGDISPLVQLKLLRVVQEREFERVGGRKTIRVDVHIIAATNKSLRQLVREGAFREDLYYRLRVVPITLPSLRERKEDIPLLVNHFLEKFRATTGKPIAGVTDAALAAMLDYDWPGNVRELENAIEYAFVRCQREQIYLADLPKELSEGETLGLIQKSEAEPLCLEEEKSMILQALKDVNGNKAKAARLLGMGRTTLYKRMRAYGING
ncbi:MAG: sigma 54-interacting transcriptional regulator [Candidatus Poribacteria bacterium]|nr:sigma 54-interacting transcriptional regulator [Candidatus Poribacteria bacterium]